jgi:hypothetical protein
MPYSPFPCISVRFVTVPSQAFFLFAQGKASDTKQGDISETIGGRVTVTGGSEVPENNERLCYCELYSEFDVYTT